MRSLLGNILVIGLFLLPGLAVAQTVVGRSVVDGKVALLYDNGTWSFDESAQVSTECAAVSPLVQFCGRNAGWSTTPPGSPEVNAAYRIDERHYAQYIIEEIGTDDGLTTDFMRKVVLENAKNAAGAEPEVIDVEKVTLGRLSGDTVVFRIKFNGVDFVFASSVFVDKKLAVQVITYAIARDYSPEHAKLHADFLSYTKLVE
ncbi:hypothetical protein [Tabrizicola sp.]|uniref:hypothetical protein n=1 Tax=Tabrizicola sp. TaxID=2005166 RepID=UPI003F2BF663